MSVEMKWSATSPGLVRYIWLLWAIWLIFLWYPLSALFRAHPGPLRVSVVLAATAAFATVYVWNVVGALARLRSGRPPRSPWPALAFLAVTALGLTLGDRRDWIELFIFVAVSFGPSLPPRRALAGVGLTVLLAPALAIALGAGAVLAAQMMFQSAISGAAVIIVVRTIVLDRELRLAREEIARLAVAEERLRFARDLHDLLGHSLSLIALKSELVGRLIPVAPERAAAENRDVEAVARRALGEVREAVSAYRRADLAGELENAREILEAAGIDLTWEGNLASIPPAQEAVLAWAVREGVTNVIKHSRARQCTIQLTRDARSMTLRVADDGTAPPPNGQRSGAVSPSGSGLRGLAERARALGGYCESGARAEGGFQVTVTLPVASAKREEIRELRPA